MNIIKKVIYIVIATIISLLMYSTIVRATTTIKVTADTLNLRKKASTSSDILATLDKGTECELIEESGEWYKIKYKTHTGFVSKEYVKINETADNSTSPSEEEEDDNKDNQSATQVTEGNTVTGKIAKDTKARLLPLINSSIIENLKKNTEITIITELNGWTYISTDTLSAWIRSDSITGKKTSNGQVTTPNSNQTDTNDDKNNIVDDDKTSETDKPSEGNTFTEKVMYVNDSYVNLRKGASTSSDIVMVVSLNTKLTVIGEEGDWYKVKTSEGNAYVSKKLLSDNKKETTSRGSSVARGETENKETLKGSGEDNKTTESSSVSSTTTASTTGNQIVSYAKKFLGVPYVYGGASSSGFDCSGFTMYVYKKFGINMRHGAQAQAKLGTPVNANKNSAKSLKENLKSGDLVFFLDYETMDEIGHCGIYVGDGNFIHASSGSGYCVKINSLLPGEYYNTRYCAARRVI